MSGTDLPVSRCPFGHGTVYVDPYPGYVHGKDPAVCPRGCEPTPASLTSAEDPTSTLRREAEEFAQLYGKEKNIEEEKINARVKEILDSIDKTGTYEHTLDEIRQGARISWRNAPKCVNRKFWATLDVIDARQATTNDEMFEAVKHHLRTAIGGDHIPVLMTVFKPETPGTNDGPRIWNSQLIRYAGHRGPNETTVGDPAELGFTDVVKKYFDWSPKSGTEGQFDPLPIVLQINNETPPTVYTLPDECISEVPIHHPTIRGISQLGLRWYGIPAVSNITLDLGGLKYSAAPFNGWYMVTEIATRNFCDEGRYNLASRIAHAMGIDTSTNETLWKDHALAAINYAVLHSFKRARVSIADHHTCAESFAQWYEDEKKSRGYVPGNWKWILPPTAASTNQIYLGLNKMTEYTIKPALVGGMSTNSLVKRSRASGYLTNTNDATATGSFKVMLAAAKWKKKMAKVTGVVILYASDGGRTQARANWFWSFVRQRFPMILPVNVANPDLSAAEFKKALQGVEFITMFASTTGSGQVPTGSEQFLEFCDSAEGVACLTGKQFAVCAFGSRAYPKFCAGGSQFQQALLRAGATEMFPIATCDQLEGEDVSVREFTKTLFTWFHSNERITESLCALMIDKLESGAKTQAEFQLMVKPRDVHGRGNINEQKSSTSATLTGRTVLGNGDRMNTVCVTLTLPEADKDLEFYEPGDHVAVYPCTNEASARYFASHFGIHFDDQLEMVADQGDAFVSINDSGIPNPLSADHLFMKVVDINKEPTSELLQILAHYVDDEESKKQMLELSLNEAVRREWIVSTGARIANIFDHFPTLSTIHRADKSLGIAMLESILLKLPKLRARYYSVSSSPQKEGNNKFSLTVGRVTWRGGYNKRMYLGFCSDFLATLPLETNVVVEMRPAPSFRLPRAPETPILMVAGGTGIAPFKGFVDHLTVNKAGTTQGDAWLIVGCQTKNNQLYRHELETAAENKVLTKYLVGYSRESTEPKRYIDVVMRENADGIRDLIARGGHVYVCGDIRIEESVRKALVDILGNGDAVKVKDLLPISPDTGTAALAQLEKEHKIHLDIFGAFDVHGTQKKQLEAALTKIKEIKVKNDP